MCPSFMATRNERDTTRARANILREVLTRSTKANPFDSDEIAAVMDLCLSCKGCKSECPSNVDVARSEGGMAPTILRCAGVRCARGSSPIFSRSMALASMAPASIHFIVTNGLTARFAQAMGWFRARAFAAQTPHHDGAFAGTGCMPTKVAHFQIGASFCSATSLRTITMPRSALRRCSCSIDSGYEVDIPRHVDSGRAQISKGLLRDAQRFAIRNVELLKDVVTRERRWLVSNPRPSSAFRDEVPACTRAPDRWREGAGEARALDR